VRGVVVVGELRYGIDGSLVEGVEPDMQLAAGVSVSL
jgi:hypothetical protein